MFDLKTLLILIPALPLAATLLTAALGRRVLRGRSHVPVVTALLLSFAASVFVVFRVQERIAHDGGAGQGGAGRGNRDALALGGRDQRQWPGANSPRKPRDVLSRLSAAASRSTSPCGPIR